MRKKDTTTQSALSASEWERLTKRIEELKEARRLLQQALKRFSTR